MEDSQSINLIERIDSYSSCKRTAIRYGTDSISYCELKKLSDTYSNYLVKLISGTRQKAVVIYMKRSVSFVVWMLACLKAGCYYVPIEASVPAERVKYIIDDITATVVVCDNATNMRVPSQFEYSVVNSETIDLSSFEFPYIDDKSSSVGDDLAYVMYTSGTSGRPKGVKIMMKNLQNLVVSFYSIVYNHYSEPINVGVVASFSFDSSVKQLYSALYYGHCLCIADEKVRYFGQKIIEFFSNYAVSVSDLTPSHIKLLLVQRKFEICPVDTLVVGGEKLRYELLNGFLARFGRLPNVINVYGPTECCVDVTYYVVSQEDVVSHENGDVPVGKPLENVSIILRNDDSSIIEEPMTIGELCIAGIQVGAGYVNNVGDSFYLSEFGPEYSSNDLAYYSEDGNIIVTGRKDRQIKINGNRVEPEEISFVISEYLKCESLVVLVNKNGRDLLVAFLLRDEMDKDHIKELNNYLRSKLVAYMIPALYICRSRLPLTINGKLDEVEINKEVDNEL